MNNLSTPTHYHPNRPKSNLIINLTLLNYSAINAWAKFNWECKIPESTKSIDPGFILDPALEEEWIEKYTQFIESQDLPSIPDSPKDADRITGAILEAMSTASNSIFKQQVKKGKGPAHSPWWMDACSEAPHNLKHNPDNHDKDQLHAAL
ncbi:hypothetical protein OPQ81_008449 [Rhizoctonia solani]|nr:hypothetical protein OPQ81_008449 [Rhizoctonia solani]